MTRIIKVGGRPQLDPALPTALAAAHRAAPGSLIVVPDDNVAGAAPARAADVTYERLLNPEPHNWLMNHRDYGAQRL